MLNPTLAASAQKTFTLTQKALDAEVDRTISPTAIDYPHIYKMLIVANTVLWIAYLLGALK